MSESFERGELVRRGETYWIALGDDRGVRAHSYLDGEPVVENFARYSPERVQVLPKGHVAVKVDDLTNGEKRIAEELTQSVFFEPKHLLAQRLARAILEGRENEPEKSEPLPSEVEARESQWLDGPGHYWVWHPKLAQWVSPGLEEDAAYSHYDTFTEVDAARGPLEMRGPIGEAGHPYSMKVPASFTDSCGNRWHLCPDGRYSISSSTHGSFNLQELEESEVYRPQPDEPKNLGAVVKVWSAELNRFAVYTPEFEGDALSWMLGGGEDGETEWADWGTLCSLGRLTVISHGVSEEEMATSD